MNYIKIDRLYRDETKVESTKQIDLDYCCNINGHDVFCKTCNEPWENYHVQDSQNEFKTIYLTQPSDDPDGDNFICIDSVDGCDCCDMEREA